MQRPAANVGSEETQVHAKACGPVRFVEHLLLAWKGRREGTVHVGARRGHAWSGSIAVKRPAGRGPGLYGRRRGTADLSACRDTWQFI